MIAGIHQSNARQSPYNNMAAAIERRNYALDRMVDNDFITKAEADAAKARPIVTHGQPTPTPSSAPYFVEAIRAQLEQRYGAKALYENGLVIRTGLDPDLQRAATVALDDGVRRLDKLRGYRKPTRNVLAEQRTVENYRHPRWTREIATGESSRRWSPASPKPDSACGPAGSPARSTRRGTTGRSGGRPTSAVSAIWSKCGS